MRGTYRTLETSHRDGTRDAPPRREPQGNGVPIVVVGVTTYQGGREDRSQGEGAQMVAMQSPCGTRNAKSQSGTAYHLSPLGNKLDCWRARVIRKRSRFVGRVATGKGLVQDGTSPVAYSTSDILFKKRINDGFFRSFFRHLFD